MQVLLTPVGRGITSLCFAAGANNWASAMGGHVSGTVEHCQVITWVIKGEGLSVNEAVYTDTAQEVTMV
jgi:hypothetical protein